jgi:OmpA-OmpF porin, OOP family
MNSRVLLVGFFCALLGTTAAAQVGSTDRHRSTTPYSPGDSADAGTAETAEPTSEPAASDSAESAEPGMVDRIGGWFSGVVSGVGSGFVSLFDRPLFQGPSEVGKQHYIGVLATYLEPDDMRAPNVDYGNGFGLLYGQQYGNRFGWEAQLSADFFETGDNGGTDYYRQSLNVDVFYALGDRLSFTPFALLGIGYGNNDVFPEDRDGQELVANAGLGFVTGPVLFENLRFRGELRYIYDNFEEGLSDYRAGIGIEFPLFRAAEAPPAETEVRVVSTGLNDADSDGVIDERDQCPETPAGERVDGLGCTLPKVYALKGVTFEFDSARLRPDSQTVLDEVKSILARYPDMQVEIAGHTDSLGNDVYNQNLSLARARAVYDYLVSAGAVADQMRVAGYGEAEPVAPNDTEEGRELNRRVELRILD